jgi:NAD(P)-dependent dehydrogenase (short-subunit alcohol dehydrogenase family)
MSVVDAKERKNGSAAGARLAGKVVIVTGGGRGLGRSYCLELAALGASVVVNDLGVALDGKATDEAPAEELVREIEENGGTAMADRGSVADHQQAEATVESAIARFGRLDAVVNNAGITRDRMLVSMTEAEFDDVVAVHIKGTFNTMSHAARYWRAQAKAGERVSGRIINTTSGSGLRGNIGQLNYGAAKAAIATMTRIAAAELAQYGVTVNAIAPVARTRMTISVGMADQGQDGFDELAPENVAPVIAYLVSERSAWLTGQVLRPEGNRISLATPWQLDEQGFESRDGSRLTLDDLDAGLRRLCGISPALLGTTGLR